MASANTSRVEQMLQAQMDGTSYNGPRLSRIEKMLGGLGDMLDDPSHGGGVSPGDLEPDNDFSDLDMDDIFSEISRDNN